MKLVATIARILVGLEFIFSGFVKVVDPYGTALKLQEYFEVFATDVPALSGFFHLLADNSVMLSLIFCALELILGVALLVAYRMPLTAWVVLGLMAFFTFLTFYSANYNKVTDCGCFGDFLKLKPWHSFYKDVISLVFILPIFLFRHHFKPVRGAALVTLLATVIAFGIGIYALRYLPPIDFLPYAVGKSIPEQMKPTGVKPDIAYTFEDRQAKQTISSKEYLMDTLRYKYVSSEILNQDAITPKITDFALSDAEGNDVTAQTFEGNKLLIGVKKMAGLSDIQVNTLKQVAIDAKAAGIDPAIVSSLLASELMPYLQKQGVQVPLYAIDEKVLKTMARVSPTFVLLQNGTVRGKWSIHAAPSKEQLQGALQK